MTEGEFRGEMPDTLARPEAGGTTRNAEIVRRMVEAFKAGDLETLRRDLKDDVVWHVPGDGVLSGDHEGPEAVLALMRAAVGETDGTLRVDLLTALGDENYGVLFIRSTGTRKNRHLDQKEVLVFAICDGQVEEVWHRPDPAQADPFFAK